MHHRKLGSASLALKFLSVGEQRNALKEVRRKLRADRPIWEETELQGWTHVGGDSRAGT
jgi:hypothetical protein